MRRLQKSLMQNGNFQSNDNLIECRKITYGKFHTPGKAFEEPLRKHFKEAQKVQNSVCLQICHSTSALLKQTIMVMIVPNVKSLSCSKNYTTQKLCFAFVCGKTAIVELTMHSAYNCESENILCFVCNCFEGRIVFFRNSRCDCSK